MSNEPKLFKKLAMISKNYALNNIVIQSALYAYETFESVAKEILQKFCEGIREQNLDPHFVKMKDYLQNKKSTKNIVIEIIKHKKLGAISETKKTRLQYLILLYLFGDYWIFVNNIRNSFEHFDGKTKLSYEDLKKIVETKLLPSMKFLIDDYVPGFERKYFSKAKKNTSARRYR